MRPLLLSAAAPVLPQQRPSLSYMLPGKMLATHSLFRVVWTRALILWIQVTRQKVIFYFSV